MKKYLPLVILGFLLITIVLTDLLVQKSQEMRKKAAPSSALYFSPATLNVLPNANFTLNADISSGTNLIAGAELNIRFNPAVVKVNGITLPTTPFLPTLAGTPTIDNVNGTARVILLSDPSTPKIGTGTLATVSFTSLQLGNTQISYDATTTQASAVNEPAGTNVITSMVPAQIQVAVPGPTPTPAPLTEVKIHPANIITFVGQTVYLSALAYSNTTPRRDSITYTWGMSSVNSIGSISSNHDLGEFRALNGGTGDLWITATDQNSSVTKSIPVTVSVPSPSPTPTPRPTPSPTPVPTPSPTPIPTPTPTPTPILIPSPTPTPTPNTASAVLKIRFEGINATNTNKTVRIILKQNSLVKYSLNIVMTGSSTGIYANTNNPIIISTPGIYDVFIKGPAHLTKKFSGQTLSAGNNVLDFSLSSQMLLAGDAVIDNAVNVYDYSDLIDNYRCGSNPPPVTKTCISMLSDYNYNGIVDIYDYNYMIGNFEMTGDQ